RELAERARPRRSPAGRARGRGLPLRAAPGPARQLHAHQARCRAHRDGRRPCARPARGGAAPGADLRPRRGGRDAQRHHRARRALDRGGPGAQTLPLVYLDDVVDALLLAARSPTAVGRVIHVVDPQPVRQDDYLARCGRVPGRRPPLLRIPAGAFTALGGAVELLGRALRRELPLSRYRVRSLRPLANVDAGASRELLGWTPRVGVERGLEITFGDEA